MSRGRPLSRAIVRRFVDRTHFVEAGVTAKVSTLMEIVNRDESWLLQCEPCPDGCTADFSKDFSALPWSLSDGVTDRPRD